VSVCQKQNEVHVILVYWATENADMFLDGITSVASMSLKTIPSIASTYPLGTGAELKDNAVVGLCKIYIASALLYCRGLSACFLSQALC